jgi:hypothetical protein
LSIFAATILAALSFALWASGAVYTRVEDFKVAEAALHETLQTKPDRPSPGRISRRSSTGSPQNPPDPTPYTRLVFHYHLKFFFYINPRA